MSTVLMPRTPSTPNTTLVLRRLEIANVVIAKIAASRARLAGDR